MHIGKNYIPDGLCTWRSVDPWIADRLQDFVVHVGQPVLTLDHLFAK